MIPAEIIGCRRTFDGVELALHSDGSVTGNGRRVRGIPRSLEAGWLALGEACLYRWAEVPALLRAALRVVRRGHCLPGDLRAELRDRALRPRRCQACRYTVAGWDRCATCLAREARRC